MRHSALVALAAMVLLCAASPARAAEDEEALSVSLSYATFDTGVDEAPAPDGAVLGVDYERGLSDAISFRVSGGGGLYCDACLAWSGHATLGFTYLFDVIRYVPYANVGVGGIAVGGDELDTRVRPLIEVGGGLDILQTRAWSWGVLARFEYFPGETAFFTAGARITWRWGFF